MRSLWRTTLWLGFAAACGGVGYWQGLGHGAEVMSDLYSMDRVSFGLANARLAMEQLGGGNEGSRRYAETNLRLALAGIGESMAGRDWLHCYPRDRQTLAAAAAYLRGHPYESPSRPAIERALRLCPSETGHPSPPIADGKYSFQLRDPEFPDAAGIPLRATVDAEHIEFVTTAASDRFPEGARFEGALTWHAGTKQWLLGEAPGDALATAVGGCSEGPEVVDLDKRIFWMC
jgi:hypothetical protein